MLTCSCVNLLDLSNSVLENKDCVAVKDVVYIESVYKAYLDTCNVTCASVDDVILLGENDECLLAGVESAENLDNFLCLDCIKLDRIDDIKHWFTQSAKEANKELGDEMVARSLEYLDGAIK